MEASGIKKAQQHVPSNGGEHASQIETVIRECAMQIIGNGYCRKDGMQGHLQGQVIEDLKQKDLLIVPTFSGWSWFTGESRESAFDAMQKSGGISVDPQRFGVSASAKGGAARSKDQSTQRNERVCIAQRMTAYRCDFVGKNCLMQRLGDSFVQSALFSSGYQVEIRVSTQKDNATSSESMHASVGTDFMGISGELSSLSEKIQQGTKIFVSVQGFGGYIPPEASGQYEDINSLKEALKKIDAHFLKELGSRKNWQYQIDSSPKSKDLKAYSDLSPERFKGLEELSTVKFPSLRQAPKGDLCSRLAEDLIEFQQEKAQLKEGKISLRQMLTKIFEILPTALEVQPPRSGEAVTMIIGPTGAGKSTFIGYMLGAKVVRDEGGSLIYDAESMLKQKLPPIGHEGSETMGCQIYKKYLDTAGSFDSRDIEAEICNTMAISIGTHRLNPQRLVVILPAGYLDAKAVQLLQYIKTLQKVVSLQNQEVKESTIFLFNGSPLNPGVLQRAIQQQLDKSCSVEQKKIDALSQRLCVDDSNPDAFVSLKTQDKIDVERLEKSTRDLEVLEMIKKNFLVPEMLSEGTRCDIQKWESSVKGIPSGSFSMEDFVEDGYLVFHSTIHLLATYLNYLQDLFKRRRSQIEEKMKQIREAEEIIKKTKGIPVSENVQFLTEQGEKDKKNLATTRQRKAALESEKKKLRSEFQKLMSNDSELFDEVFPHRKYPDELHWRWIPYWTKMRLHTKIISYPGSRSIPILDVKPVTKTGSFYDLDKKKYASGQLDVTFEPGRLRTKDDDSKLSIYIRKKDHPSRVERRKQIEKQLIEIDEQLKDEEAKLCSLEEILGNNDVSLHYAQASEGLSKYERELKKLTREYNDLSAKISDYRDFVPLARGIVKSLENVNHDHYKRDSVGNETFRRFLLNFN